MITQQYLSMADDIDIANLPHGQDVYVYAGYSGGLWPDYWQLTQAFPGKLYLAFAISASQWGDTLDIERGDATIDDAPRWAREVWRPINITKPGLYINAANVQALVDAMTAAGWARTSYWLISAHYGQGIHICGPTTCNETGGEAEADGTQWFSAAFDLSTVPADMFLANQPPPTPPAPIQAPPPLEDPMFVAELAGTGFYLITGAGKAPIPQNGDVSSLLAVLNQKAPAPLSAHMLDLIPDLIPTVAAPAPAS